jgi:hypothetical protein
MSFTPRQLYPGTAPPVTHSIGENVCPRARLTIMKRRKKLLSLAGIAPTFLVRPARNVFTIPTELSRLSENAQ